MGGVVVSNSTKVGIIVGSEALGSAVAGAGTKMIANKIDGKDLNDGIIQHAFISGITGGIASGAGA